MECTCTDSRLTPGPTITVRLTVRCPKRSLPSVPCPQFNRIVAGLMLVGMASGRTVLLPDIPCEAW